MVTSPVSDNRQVACEEYAEVLAESMLSSLSSQAFVHTSISITTACVLLGTGCGSVSRNDPSSSSHPAASQVVASQAASVPVIWTPPGIASEQYEAAPAFGPDGRELIFMRADRQFASYRLMTSRCGEAGWSAPVELPFAAPALRSDADPAFTADGRRLYFISTRQNQQPSDEDFDIWTVERDAAGTWGMPVRLPEPVNSPGSELFPRPTRDGRLYFGSDRPGGLGGGDIYVATPPAEASGTWKVENLGVPINSAAFEYEAEISRDEQTLIAVIDRGDRSHLYRFERQGGSWVERDRIPARPDVFQVGPLLSPDARRLLFAQVANPERSGELFLADLAPGADVGWPPACPAK